MTDEEYLFKQTSLERKRIGRGDFNKKRQGGKQIRFPSDNLSRKEREAMNGECKTYDMAHPVKWEAFKLWPEDLQRNYLLGLGEKFGVGVAHLVDMFRVSPNTIYKLTNKLDVHLDGRQGRGKLEPWFAFLNGEPVTQESKPAEVSPDVLVSSAEDTSAVKRQGPVTLDATDAMLIRLMDLVTSLKGSGSVLELKIVL